MQVTSHAISMQATLYDESTILQNAYHNSSTVEAWALESEARKIAFQHEKVWQAYQLQSCVASTPNVSIKQHASPYHCRVGFLRGPDPHLQYRQV